MKFRLLIICLFLYLNGNSQTSTLSNVDNSKITGLSEEEFIYACKEYKKMMETDTYLENNKKARLNAEKMYDALSSLDYKNLPIDSLKNNNIYLKWIEKNIKKTKFKSFDEAKVAIEDQIASQEKLEKENPKLFELLDKATLEQRHTIFKPFFDMTHKEMLGY